MNVSVCDRWYVRAHSFECMLVCLRGFVSLQTCICVSCMADFIYIYKMCMLYYCIPTCFIKNSSRIRIGFYVMNLSFPFGVVWALS